jgi:hypothetical protein
MHKDSRERGVGASMTMVVERMPEDAPASWTPRRACEVNYYPDVSQMATVRRGVTIADALAKVLRDR